MESITPSVVVTYTQTTVYSPPPPLSLSRSLPLVLPSFHSLPPLEFLVDDILHQMEDISV